MSTVTVNAEAWYQSKEVIAAVTGAAVAFFLVVAYDWLRARRRRRAHFAALRAEMEYCYDLAQAYLRDRVAAPLYRLPTVAYSSSLPALLSEASLSECDARALLSFFNEVETLNRGLEQAEAARLIADARERDTKLAEEFSRNMLKAQKLVPVDALSPSYYDQAKSVIDSRLRWYRL
jgi:hypothetical protein